MKTRQRWTKPMMKEKWKLTPLLKGKPKEVQGSQCTREDSCGVFLVLFWVSPPNQHPSLSSGDVVKKRGEKWKNSAADDKQRYEEKAAKLKRSTTRRLLQTELRERLLRQKRESSRLKNEWKRRKWRKMKRMKRKKTMMNKLILAHVCFFLVYKAFKPFLRISFLLKKKNWNVRLYELWF